MFHPKLFKAMPPKVQSGGPKPEQQLLAMAEGRYWTVLNAHLLLKCKDNAALSHEASVFKHALQTFGPASNELPDFRQNKRVVVVHDVFHGHIKSNGTTYVLEWAIVSQEERIIALVGFGKHENYSFKQKALSAADRESIFKNKENIKIIEKVAVKTQEAIEKVARQPAPMM
jgi:hypothetical protein